MASAEDGARGYLDILVKVFENDPGDVEMAMDQILEPTGRPSYEPTSDYGVCLAIIKTEAQMRIKNYQEGNGGSKECADRLWPYVIQRIVAVDA